jgi:hypothetical protein
MTDAPTLYAIRGSMPTRLLEETERALKEAKDHERAIPKRPRPPQPRLTQGASRGTSLTR